MRRPQFPISHFGHSGEKLQQDENPGRERILARIQKGLRSPAPKHAPSEKSGKIFAAIIDPLDRFQKECAQNGTECLIVPNVAAVAEAFERLLDPIPPGEIFVQDAPELRPLVANWREDRSIRWSSEGRPLEQSQATVTLVEALVAQTGSIFVSAACGGRAASVVAPVHIVIASIQQLVPDLGAASVRLRERGAVENSSMLCLITGPSRTADIEKIIVMGAHGPRRVVVILSLEPLS
jgi:L-lactate dehydrogenase complex protein LldG